MIELLPVCENKIFTFVSKCVSVKALRPFCFEACIGFLRLSLSVLKSIDCDKRDMTPCFVT